MRNPSETKFRDLPTGHYFTSGWTVYYKTGDRVAIQTSGMFDGAGTFHNFAPDKVVYSWGETHPTHQERENLFLGIELPRLMMTGYRVNLTQVKLPETKISTLEGQVVRSDPPTHGNFFIAEDTGHA